MPDASSCRSTRYNVPAIVIGVTIVLLGVPSVIFVYAHAAIIDPALPPPEWRWAVAKRFFFMEGGVGSVALLFTLAGATSALAAVMRFRVRGVWILALTLLLAALLLARFFA